MRMIVGHESARMIVRRGSTIVANERRFMTNENERMRVVSHAIIANERHVSTVNSH